MSAFQPPGGKYRDPTSSARTATVALMLAALMQAGAGLVSVNQLASGDTLTFWVSEQGTIALSGAFRFYQWVSLLISIAVYVAWLAWQYRVHTNARLAAPDRAPTGPGWGVLCWFVPFVNLVKPYLVLREIRAVSVPERPGRWILRLWWGTWLGGAIVLSLAMIDVMVGVFEKLRGPTLPQRLLVEVDEGALQLVVAAELLVMLAALFGALVIREVTRGQVALWRTADVAGLVPTRPDVR